MLHRFIGPPAAFLLTILLSITALTLVACNKNAETNATNEAAVENAGAGINAATETNATASTGTSDNSAAFSTGSNENQEVLPGRGAFTKPPAMEIGAWYTIEFHTGPDEQALVGQAQGAPTTQSQPIHISRHMKVTLEPDPNFQVRPKSKEEQDTGADWAATWAWDVKPVTEGVHTLMAHVEVMMHDAKGVLVHYDEYDSRVAVKVSVGSWQGLLNGLANAKSLGDALTTLFQSWRGTLLALGGLLSAAAALRWAFRSGRKRSAEKHAKPRT